MSEDRRETILARLKVVAATVVEARCTFRNDLNVPDAHLPAVAILDADESTDDDSFHKNRSAAAPLIMDLTPEIYIFVKEKGDEAGPAISDLRSRLVKAILTDASLLETCKDGAIQYHGLGTTFAVGRAMTGAAVLAFTFRYMLFPTRL